MCGLVVVGGQRWSGGGGGRGGEAGYAPDEWDLWGRMKAGCSVGVLAAGRVHVC